MIYTDIAGNTLIAYGDTIKGEIVVEIAPKGLDRESTQAFLEYRKSCRKTNNYTTAEQVLLSKGEYKPKQW